MVSGLSLYHITLAFNNLTTLESMGGSNMRGPCDSQAATEKKLVHHHFQCYYIVQYIIKKRYDISFFYISPLKFKQVNKYDRGMLANLYEFFGETSLWWWWPTVPTMIHQGMKNLNICS